MKDLLVDFITKNFSKFCLFFFIKSTNVSLVIAYNLIVEKNFKICKDNKKKKRFQKIAFC